MTRHQDRAKSAPGQFHCRHRICLLKGCGNRFRPECPSSRYCSEKCQAVARCWSIARAREHYRQTKRGKKKRREQSCRYRCRCKEREVVCDQMSGRKRFEGDQQEGKVTGILCARPGCYTRVCADRRSPLRKFCSSSCCRAVRRVVERESRWRQRIAKWLETVIGSRGSDSSISVAYSG